MVLQNVKGLGLFAARGRAAGFAFALDNAGRMGIIRDRKGTLQQAVSPRAKCVSLGLMTRRNRHLPEWRFLLFSFWTRIEIE